MCMEWRIWEGKAVCNFAGVWYWEGCMKGVHASMGVLCVASMELSEGPGTRLFQGGNQMES